MAVLSHGAGRVLASAWFAALSFLLTSLFFRRLSMASHGRSMFIFLPAVSAALAGFIWGGPILRSTGTRYGQSMLRGMGVAGGAFAIFALLFPIALWRTEPGWAFNQIGGLFLATMTFGFLLLGPLALITGSIGGGLLFLLGRCISSQR